MDRFASTGHYSQIYEVGVSKRLTENTINLTLEHSQKTMLLLHTAMDPGEHMAHRADASYKYYNPCALYWNR
jgi:hypothetical protein